MASERILNEYDGTRIANAVDTLANNLTGYSGTTITPTDAMKAKLPSQSTGDRIADAVEDLATNFLGTDIIDNLTSTATDSALSANQGKVLNDGKMNKLVASAALSDASYATLKDLDPGVYIIMSTATNSPESGTYLNAWIVPRKAANRVVAYAASDNGGLYVMYSASDTHWKLMARGDAVSTIEATGSTNTTGSTITKGKYFFLHSTLCKAKTDIATNATFTRNTNYEVVTVGEELSTLNNNLAVNHITISSTYNCRVYYNDIMVRVVMLKAPIALQQDTPTVIQRDLPTLGFSFQSNINDNIFVTYTTDGVLSITVHGRNYDVGNWLYGDVTIMR